MAIIIKKKGDFVVAYKIKEKGKIVTKIEPFWNLKEATKRSKELSEIEYPIEINLDMKIKDFVLLYYDLIGKHIWSYHSYQSAIYQYNAYIVGVLKNDKMKIVDTAYAKQLLEKLKKLKVKSGNHMDEYISVTTLEKIFIYIKMAFDMAFQIKLYPFNPFDIGMKFTRERANINRWTKDIVIEVFEACEKSKLFIFLHLVFGCHMLAKEALGITWNEIYIDDEHYACNMCYIKISKELQRVDINLAKATSTQEIIKTFDPVKNDHGNTRLAILTRLGGESIVQIPKQVVSVLRDWKTVQQMNVGYEKDTPFNEKFVISLAKGKPCEYRVIEKEFNALRNKLGYPTLKLGQLKAFSQTRYYNGDTKKENIAKSEVYEELLERGYLDSRTIAFREIQIQKVIKQRQKVELRNVFPDEKEEIDLFALVQEIKKDPKLSKEFSRLLTE